MTSPYFPADQTPPRDADVRQRTCQHHNRPHCYECYARQHVPAQPPVLQDEIRGIAVRDTGVRAPSALVQPVNSFRDPSVAIQPATSFHASPTGTTRPDALFQVPSPPIDPLLLDPRLRPLSWNPFPPPEPEYVQEAHADWDGVSYEETPYYPTPVPFQNAQMGGPSSHLPLTWRDPYVQIGQPHLQFLAPVGIENFESLESFDGVEGFESFESFAGFEGVGGIEGIESFETCAGFEGPESLEVFEEAQQKKVKEPFKARGPRGPYKKRAPKLAPTAAPNNHNGHMQNPAEPSQPRPFPQPIAFPPAAFQTGNTRQRKAGFPAKGLDENRVADTQVHDVLGLEDRRVEDGDDSARAEAFREMSRARGRR